MKKLLALLLLLTSPAVAATGPYGGEKIDTAQGIVVSTQPGTMCYSASSTTVDTCTILLDGKTGNITSQQIQDIENRPTGMRVKDEGILLNEVSSINFVGAPITAVQVGDQINVTISDLSDAIRSSSTLLGENTTASTSWVSVPGSTLTLVGDSSQFLEIELSCNIEADDVSRAPYAFSFLVDGAYFDGGSAALSTAIEVGETEGSLPGSRTPLKINHKTATKLTPGSHDISLLWASSSGETLRMGRGVKGCSLIYKESPEQFNAGAAGTVSGAQNFGAQTSAAFQTSLVCDVLPCQAQGNFGNFCLWVATGTTVGSWMNVCNQLGPYD